MTSTTVTLTAGDIAYADPGDGPTALFVHGVLVNADLWRHAIAGLADMLEEFCVALDLARSEVGFAQGYRFPEKMSDELLTSYLGALVADGDEGLERFLTSPTTEELMAVEPLLARLHVPTQVIWGTGDTSFEPFWAERLRNMILGVERVSEIPDAMLFYPGERAGERVPLLRSFWELHG